jgi:ABC-type sugar transport system ATPase subunit
MADRFVCMRTGRIGQIGTPDDLDWRPQSLFIASFIGSCVGVCRVAEPARHDSPGRRQEAFGWRRRIRWQCEIL